jgi:CheY-like chemotaxis protein
MNTVFIVDDDGLLREMLKRSLGNAGYNVETFGSPALLLRAFDSDRPDIVVSDVKMPEMNGLELTAALRKRSRSFPVILMSAHVTPAVESQATELGVSHVLHKPIKDASILAKLIGEILTDPPADRDAIEDLDQLRLGFLTGLSHELRTPLTAIKFALDGLFSDGVAGATPASRKLVDIGQRNIDRIIRVVENQLDLLQVTLGELAVSRRLACLDEIIEDAARQSHTARLSARSMRHLGKGSRRYLFTDPERLQSVIEYTLNRGSSDPSTGIGLFVSKSDDADEIAIDFTNIRTTNGSDGRMDFGGGRDTVGQHSNSPGAFDFERRAFRSLVDALGCEIERGHGQIDRLRLRLPIFPRYDQWADLTMPLRHLHRAAVLSDRSVCVIRCFVRPNSNHDHRLHPIEHEFLLRCLSTLSDGDVLVRGRMDGEFYLALLERTDAQIEEIVSFVEKPTARDDRHAITAELIRTSNSSDPAEALARDLENTD